MKYACTGSGVSHKAIPLKSWSVLALAMIGAFCGASPATATPLLGSDLASFTVLGTSTVTAVPTNTIGVNVGVWSSDGANAVTGFNSSPGVAVPDSQVTGGLVHAGTVSGAPNAKTAQSQLGTAIANLRSLGAGTLLAADLVGLKLLPGIYTVPAGATNLSGELMLDGGGNANAAWVFQMPSTLITSPNSVVSITDTGAGAGVYWNVGSSATIDTNTTFLGNILAASSITMNTDATDLCGRVLAKTGAVTLSQNALSGVCTDSVARSGSLSGGLNVMTTPNGFMEVASLPFAPVSTAGILPEPATLALLGVGLAWIGFTRRRTG